MDEGVMRTYARADEVFVGGHGAVVVDDNFDFNFWDEVDDVFGAGVDRRFSAAGSKPSHLGDRHPARADRVQAVFDVVEFVGANDRFDFFHVVPTV